MWGHALHANLKAVVAPTVILIQVQRYHVLCEKQKNLHIVNSFEEFLDSLRTATGDLARKGPKSWKVPLGNRGPSTKMA